MPPASNIALWTGITEERKIGPGTRIGWTFFKVFVTIKRIKQKKATPSNRDIFFRIWVKSLFPEHAASVTDRPLNRHNWGTADWPGYPHWCNVFLGICDNKTLLSKKRNTVKSSYFSLKLGKIAIPTTCGHRQRPPFEQAYLRNVGLVRVPALVKPSSRYLLQ